MKYVSSNNIEVSFHPWFDGKEGQHRFTYIHLYEELGGSIAYGEMGMEMNGSGEALKLDDEERTGVLEISDLQSGGISYTIPVFITDLARKANIVVINFYCISDQSFVTDQRTNSYNEAKIRDVIYSIYPGKVDLRTDPDIQGNFNFHQNKETTLDFCAKLCMSYKKSSVFAFGWEGLMLKDLFGDRNSRGNMEPDTQMKIVGDSEYTQLTGFRKARDRGLYYRPQNVWEDKKNDKYSIRDYTEQEPINLRVYKKYTTSYMFSTPYSQLFENYAENKANMESDLYQHINIANYYRLPLYKLGDVLTYIKESNTENKRLNWPYKYYLVKSNELFLSIDGSPVKGPGGFNFSWTSVLLGLEENGQVALGSEKDPQEGKTA